MRDCNDKVGSVRRQKRARRGIVGLVLLAVALACVAVGLAVAAAFNSSSALTSVSAQADVDLREEEESSEPHVDYASTQVVDLVSLMGLSRDEAIERIGHGATVQDQGSLSSLGFSKEVVVALSDETGDAASGTPTVTLGLDGDGRVAAASYEAATSLLGYGDLSFVDAVERFCIVEDTLGKAGLSSVKQGSVTLPEREAYSTYESDRKTLSREMYTFKGSASLGDADYTWDATLDYDYADANETGNLANTVKKITVAVMKA